ncbi:MAG: hypothetical protein NXI13_16430 [Proteobacteria bacterium]|nr:hypothetical protein [Pseudomonadota bacterium]
MAENPLPPPPRSVPQDLYQWLVKVLTPRVSERNALKWDQVDKTGTSVEDLGVSEPEVSQEHRASSSEHGATGNIVGTDDRPTGSVGGSVLHGGTVTDLNASAAVIGGAYNQAQVQAIEDKAQNASAKIDALMAALRTAGIIS